MEYSDPDQREKEREALERRERQRQSRLAGEVFGLPVGKWLGLTEEPAQLPSSDDEGAGDGGILSYFTSRASGVTSDADREREKEIQESKSKRGSIERPLTVEKSTEARDDATVTPLPTPGPSRPELRTGKSVSRSRSTPQFWRESSRNADHKWGRVRSLLSTVARQNKEAAPSGHSAVQPLNVNITDELIAGGLSTLMLRLWFERDEHGNRRVPVLFHRLRVRISDSLAPLSGNKAVFRIECEYANGAARWVVYRQLRDFISLHTHYRLSNVYNRTVDTLPDFPRTSMLMHPLLASVADWF